MAEQRIEQSASRAELHRRLCDGLAHSRLKKSQLAAQAHLGRTTVSEAFNPNAPAPSAGTVSALARVLRLPVDELLELRRQAAQEVVFPTAPELVPGRPISAWEPHDLEVHPAGSAEERTGARSVEKHVLPTYVRREHDRVLADAVRDGMEGRSRMLVLVGSSSTGKTRACWEAVQPLAGTDWRLWHPFDPTRAEAALEDLHRIQPRTVVWFNEAQHYLGDPRLGEQIAAAVHSLLTQPERGPVLVLATLWPEYVDQYTSLPEAKGPDPHSRTRELITRRTVVVPERFDDPAMAAAAAYAADDPLLGDALSRTLTTGRVTQDLAGVPELLHRYERGTPAAKAILEAAMDARRLGVGLHLPQTFLTDAAIDYLSDADYGQLHDGWAEAAYAELARPVHGKQAPLHRVSPRPKRNPPGPPRVAAAHDLVVGPAYRLADYLEQHGRKSRHRLCPPASFWHAAHAHVTHPNDLENLVEAAASRHRLQWAHYLRVRSAEAGSVIAQIQLGKAWEAAGHVEEAEALYRQAADAGDVEGLVRLVALREEAGKGDAAEALSQAVHPDEVEDLTHLLATMRAEAIDGDATFLAWRTEHAADEPEDLIPLARMQETAGQVEEAEALYRQAADAGDVEGLARLAVIREKAGQPKAAEALALQATQNGHTTVLISLADMRHETGDQESAEHLYQQAADALDLLATQYGHTDAMVTLADMRHRAGDQESAEHLYQQAADAGSPIALIRLAVKREEAGERDAAEALALQAVRQGHTSAMVTLANMRQRAGDQESAEHLYQQAADAGSPFALIRLAAIREEAGDAAHADALIRQFADAGRAFSLLHPAWMSWTSDRQLLPWQRWPYGLEPDGQPTAPWTPSSTE
ncbi:hypothetical protein ACWCQ1_43900 [Streptomyces sp. NPDC002144]